MTALSPIETAVLLVEDRLCSAAPCSECDPVRQLIEDIREHERKLRALVERLQNEARCGWNPQSEALAYALAALLEGKS